MYIDIHVYSCMYSMMDVCMCVPCVHHLSNCPLQVLQERLGVRCLLGLTATATHATALSVGQHLRVNEDSIIRGHMLPDNLHISVSCDQDRDQVGIACVM